MENSFVADQLNFRGGWLDPKGLNEFVARSQISITCVISNGWTKNFLASAPA